jgi:hypothetical protein
MREEDEDIVTGSEEVGVPLVELGDEESDVDQHSSPSKRPCVDLVEGEPQRQIQEVELCKDQLWECVQMEISEFTDDEVKQFYEERDWQAQGREPREFILEWAQVRISGLSDDQIYDEISNLYKQCGSEATEETRSKSLSKSPSRQQSPQGNVTHDNVECQQYDRPSSLAVSIYQA